MWITTVIGEDADDGSNRLKQFPANFSFDEGRHYRGLPAFGFRVLDA
jgi:hypothetical protein